MIRAVRSGFFWLIAVLALSALVLPLLIVALAFVVVIIVAVALGFVVYQFRRGWRG